jgi:hypothetical protein
MIPPDVQVTPHAWERFVERMAAVSPTYPSCPMMTLQVILEEAVPEDLGAGAVIRMLRNGLQPAAYYRYGKLRLVLDEDRERLITIEIAALGRPHKPKHKRKRP